LLTERDLLNPGQDQGKLRFYTSGKLSAFSKLLDVLLEESGPASGVAWLNDRELMLRVV
jgi:hypothetical protein